MNKFHKYPVSNISKEAVMFKRTISVAAILLALSSIQIQASYYAYAQLKVVVKKVLNKPYYSKRLKKYAVLVQLKVIHVGKGGGHNKFHCKRYLGKTFKVPLLLQKKSQTIKPGVQYKILYWNMNGLTPRGAVTRTKWTVLGKVL